MKNITGFEPSLVFKYFDEITKIPRGSGNEENIAEYLLNFAKEKNLEVKKDSIGNVIIKKEASDNYKDAPTVILQGHMDMVCESVDRDFNFLEDPIDYKIEDDFIISEKTTLGADNGIGVAMILAALDMDIDAPKIEALFTVNEENGMTGARNLDGSLLEGKRLINLDSEEEGVACISCSGGQKNKIVLEKEFEHIKKNRLFYELSVTGLKGGHSGSDVNKGLANSNKMLAKALLVLNEKIEIDLIDIEGGKMPNAIPRNARAIIAIDEADKVEIQDLIVKINKDLMSIYYSTDENLRVNFDILNEKYEEKLSDSLKEDIIYILNVIHSGVYRMSTKIEGLVELSLNLGVINSLKDIVEIHTNIRSAKDELVNETSRTIRLISEKLGYKFVVNSQYPAWDFLENSELLEIVKKSYKESQGKELLTEAIHAGLECGLFKETIGDIDMISIGPNIYGVHSPGEKVQISSVKRVFDFLLNILKNMKN